MNGTSLARRFLILAMLLIASYGAQYLILGGLPVTQLGKAPALAGSVAPSLATSANGSTDIPQAGKDFKVLDSQYFDSGRWAVVSVEKPSAGKAYLVLKKITGVYTVVLGPGTSFSTDTTRTMPPDVAEYLLKQGVIH